MSTRVNLSARVAVALALAAGVAACGKKQNQAATTDTAAGGVATAAAPAPAESANTGGTTAGAAALGSLTDPEIVYLVDEANKADSAAGALALKKAKNANVKSFARQMTVDHHRLREQGQQLAKKLKVTPQKPANDPVEGLANQEMSALESASGAAFDSTYMNHEVQAHQAVLDLLNKAHDAAQNAELKELIGKAQPVIQQHLSRAEQIQKELGSKTA